MTLEESIKKELTFKTSRSSGPGGQYVNKTSSRVEAIFDLQTTTLFVKEEKTLLREKLFSFIDSKDLIHVVCDTFRSQLRNKKEAIHKITELIEAGLIKPKKRKPTRPSKSAIERRLKKKKLTSQKKQNRKGGFD